MHPTINRDLARIRVEDMIRQAGDNRRERPAPRSARRRLPSRAAALLAALRSA